MPASSCQLLQWAVDPSERTATWTMRSTLAIMGFGFFFLLAAAAPSIAVRHRARVLSLTFFQISRSGGAAAVLAARDRAVANEDTSLDDVYALVLYRAEPHRFANAFVASFQTTTAGVMGDYAETIGRGGLISPPTFPFADTRLLDRTFVGGMAHR